MDARLTNEQKQMQGALDEFLTAKGGTELARQVMNGERDVVNDLWEELGEKDYTALTIPTDYGGLGEGLVFLSAILESAGRYAMPGPYPETMAAVVPLVSELGTEEQCEHLYSGILSDNWKTTIAVYDDAQLSLPESIQMDVTREDGAFTLDGSKQLVPYAESADRIIVAARTRNVTGFNGISLFTVDAEHDGITIHELDSLDRTRPLYDVEFDGVKVDGSALLGSYHGSGDALKRALDRYAVARTAMLVGAADRAVDLSVEHGNERTQYGQPIGRFQAVKHRIVNMWMEMQNARSLVYHAAWCTDSRGQDNSYAVAAMEQYAADRLHDVFGRDIWNHGGMGYTWDYDGHIYLKQAKAWRNLFGDPKEYSEQLLEAKFRGGGGDVEFSNPG